MTFTPEVYEIIRKGCIDSARAIVPHLADRYKPEIVLDVGGGEGWWAREFVRCGAEAACVDLNATRGGLWQDGVSMVDADITKLQVGPERGVINTSHPEHVTIGPVDLALCLEVAEHLPEVAAPGLVAFLCGVAETVVFSAAIPGQGGHGHINEQWPRYWADLFAQHGYDCDSYLRWRFWDYDDIEPWYRQNLLVFYPQALSVLAIRTRPDHVVHPAIWAWKL